MNSREHLPSEVIKNFAYRTGLLSVDQLQHCLELRGMLKGLERILSGKLKHPAEKIEAESRHLLRVRSAL